MKDAAKRIYTKNAYSRADRPTSFRTAMEGTFTSSLGTSETIVYATTHDKSPVLFLLIGGNPCVPHFYSELAAYIYASADGGIDVIVAGHLGHDGSNINGDQLFDLPQQVQHHLAFLTKSMNEDQDLRVVLCGHSVGAFMVLQLMGILRTIGAEQRILKALLLFPTIMDIASTPNGEKECKRIEYRSWVARGAWIMSKVPGVHVQGARSGLCLIG